MAIRPEQRADFSKLVAGFPDVNRGIKPVEVVLRHLQPPVTKEITIKPYSDAESFLKTERGTQYLGILRLLNGIQEKIAQAAPDQEIAPLVKEVLAQIAAGFDDINDRFALAIAGEEDDIFQGLLAEVLGELNQWDIAEYFVVAPEVTRAPEREVFQPRNDFELFLVQKRATDFLELPQRESFDTEDEYKEALNQRYQNMASVFLGIVLSSLPPFSEASLTFSGLGTQKLSVSKSSGNENITAKDLSKLIVDGIPQEEVPFATKMMSELNTHFWVMDSIQSFNEKFNNQKKSYSMDGILEVFQSPDQEDFNKDFWKGLRDLPAFAIKNPDGTWVIEDVPMGQKMFIAMQGILIKGRKGDETHVNDPDQTMILSLENFPQRAFNARDYIRDIDGKVKWRPKKVRTNVVNDNAVFPWTTIPSSSINKKKTQYSEVKSKVAADKGGNPGITDTWATMEMTALLDVLLEGAYQDAEGGKTLGIRMIDRLVNMLGYGSKAVQGGDTQDREYRIGTGGLFRRMYLPFLDHHGYGGETLTERIMKARSFHDIDWDAMSDAATKEYFQAIKDATSLAKVAFDGYAGGSIDSIGKIDVKTNKVTTVNNQLIQSIKMAWSQMFRYQFKRDASPTAAGFNLKESNPTGQYVRVVLRDRRTGAEQNLDTRIFQFYIISHHDLVRWLDPHEADQKNIQADYDPVSRTMSIEYSSPLDSKGKAIDPEVLIGRQLLYSYFMATAYEGDRIQKLGSEDIILLGMVLSAEVRHLYEQWKYNGVVQPFFANLFSQVDSKLIEDFLVMESPNIDGINIFSAKGFEQLLFFMGHKVTLSDGLTKGTSLVSSLTGIKSS